MTTATDIKLTLDDFQAVIDGLGEEELLAAIRGEIIPTALTVLDQVDLGAIAPEFDFEEPGLHKRARAGLGNLVARSLDNVRFTHVGAEDVVESTELGYHDFDRRIWCELLSGGSTWGSERGVALAMVDGYHVSGGRSIGYPHYLDRGFIAVVTNSEGTPSLLVRLHFAAEWCLPKHQAVLRIWDELSQFVRAHLLEEVLSGGQHLRLP